MTFGQLNRGETMEQWGGAINVSTIDVVGSASAGAGTSVARVATGACGGTSKTNSGN